MTAVPPPATPRYALVTPARNEAELIDQTLRSVVKQTVLPVRWIVVSDGSTDGTDEIVEKYARIHPWIELLRLERAPGRDFASKTRAFNAGYERLRQVQYDIVGNLDADLSFDGDYFAFLLERFVETPDLGVAGTPFLEAGSHYNYRFASTDHVVGCCQLFRRACFEEIGGFVPLEAGGEDWIAVTTARMMGWRTRTFLDKATVHHRRLGSASGVALWKIWLRRGAKDYALGSHPLWELARSIYQSTSPPYLLAGVLLLAGYVSGVMKGAKRPISRQLVQFHRAEQMLRLKQILLRGAAVPTRG